MLNNSRGTALIESLPVMSVLLIFIGGMLLAGYLMFARSWIQFQSEQALYCVAQTPRPWNCHEKLKMQLKRFLPWGDVWANIESQDSNWTVEVKWSYSDYSFHLKKELNPELILNPKALL